MSMVKKQALVMGIDIGTSSVKCILLNAKGDIANSASHGYPIYSPQPSWIEQYPLDWWTNVIEAVKDCIHQVDTSLIEAISLSGHMSAAVWLDDENNPVYPSILVADTRSQKQTERLFRNHMDKFVSLTGNKPADGFAVSKLLWLKETKPELFNNIKKVIFPKDYIRYKLTGYVGTEPTDAGNTLLYNRIKNEWDRELIEELDLKFQIFPDIFKTTEIFGYVTKQASEVTGLPCGIPVITGAADMACSQLGTGVIKENIIAITLSTSGQVVAKVQNIVDSGVGLVTFHPSALEDTLYAMGSVFTGGLGVNWAYRLLFEKSELNAGNFNRLQLLNKEMESIKPGSDGLLFLPFIVGSGTPYFDSADRGSWLGLSLSHGKQSILHSVYEGIGYNIRENMEIFSLMNPGTKKIYIGGGGSKNELWCKTISNILGQDIYLLEKKDVSAIGAAIIAGLGIGMFSTIEKAVESIVEFDRVIECDKEKSSQYDLLYTEYREIYKVLNKFYRSKNKNYA